MRIVDTICASNEGSSTENCYWILTYSRERLLAISGVQKTGCQASLVICEWWQQHGSVLCPFLCQVTVSTLVLWWISQHIQTARYDIRGQKWSLCGLLCSAAHMLAISISSISNHWHHKQCEPDHISIHTCAMLGFKAERCSQEASQSKATSYVAKIAPKQQLLHLNSLTHKQQQKDIYTPESRKKTSKLTHMLELMPSLLRISARVKSNPVIARPVNSARTRTTSPTWRTYGDGSELNVRWTENGCKQDETEKRWHDGMKCRGKRVE